MSDSAADIGYLRRPRPYPVTYCKPCLGRHNLKPLPGQETISPNSVVHYGMDTGRTLCGKDATGDGWWWSRWLAHPTGR